MSSRASYFSSSKTVARAQAYRGLVQLRLENDIGTFDDCCTELENVENSCLIAIAFSLLAVIFSAGLMVHKGGGVYNAFKVRVLESTAGASERACLMSPVSRKHVSSERRTSRGADGANGRM